MITVGVLGKGQLATYIARSIYHSEEHELAFVVPSIPQSPLFESLADFAHKRQIPCIETGLPRQIAVPVDLLICSSYNRILGRKDIKKHGRAVNFHFSPLPSLRGVRPINWALESGARFHGVTLHLIDEGIDTGGILDQMIFPIDSGREEVIDVYKKCVMAGIKIFDRSLPNLVSAPGNLQNNFAPSYFSSADESSLVQFRELTRFPSRLKSRLPM